jgi:hypothetical protein
MLQSDLNSLHVCLTLHKLTLLLLPLSIHSKTKEDVTRSSVSKSDQPRAVKEEKKAS